MDEKPPKNIAKGYLLVFTAVTLWSFSEIIQKLLQGSVQAMSLSFLRFFFAFIPLLILLCLNKDFAGMDIITKKHWRELVIAGILAMATGNYVMFVGIRQTQANIGSAIYQLIRFL